MYKHILVAIDDSHTSELALEEAIGLARLHEAQMEVIHVIDESLVQAYRTHGVALANPAQIRRSLLEAGQGLIEESVARARAAGVTQAQGRLIESDDGHTADLVAEAVERFAADLLVVGSHGRRGFQRLLLGSVAERLVRKITISLLIVRGKE